MRFYEHKNHQNRRNYKNAIKNLKTKPSRVIDSINLFLNALVFISN